MYIFRTEFVEQSGASLVGDHFLDSCDLIFLFRGYCKEKTKLDASHS